MAMRHLQDFRLETGLVQLFLLLLKEAADKSGV